MQPRFFKLNMVFGSVFLLASCAGFSQGNWPSLSEGFKLRDDPQQMVSEVNDDAPEVITQEVQELASEEIIKLKQDISVQQKKYAEALKLMEGAELLEKERHWFSAQLELSRLAALKDTLGNFNHNDVQDYLLGLEGYISGASKELRNLKLSSSP